MSAKTKLINTENGLARECCKCHVVKLFTEFSKSKSKSTGHCSQCKECRAKKAKEDRINNHEHIRAREKALLEKWIAEDPDYWKKNSEKRKSTPGYKEKASIAGKKTYHKNKEKNAIKKKAYYQQKERKEHVRKYTAEKRKNDIQYRLKQSLSNRIRDAIKNAGGTKSLRTVELLGSDVAFARKYLESQFTEGMSWDNYGHGNDKWNIEHIQCCRSFDLTDIEQQKICFNYTNLKPLWQKDNFSKNDKMSDGTRARDIIHNKQPIIIIPEPSTDLSAIL